MSRDEFQYQRIFQILKNKIESGAFPKGASLPSMPKLCKEYAVSAKTIRRVLTMLSDAGLIETSEGKRAIVIDQPKMCIRDSPVSRPGSQRGGGKSCGSKPFRVREAGSAA